jgi:6-phosphogluconolactonase
MIVKEYLMIRTSHLLLTAALAISVVLPARSKAQTESRTSPAGAVFAMTNSAAKNEIIAYSRGADGTLLQGQSFPTGGRGSGGVTDPLGSQGSLTLTKDHHFLLAVNAGSGNISVFVVFGSDLFLLETVPCGGSEPVAIAQHGDLVYVLNAGGASSVSGFTLAWDGRLRPVHNSLTYLSTGNSGAASLGFSPNGKFLLVTEKLTGNIDAFPVKGDGTLGPIVVNASAGPGLFSVLFAPNGTVLATETGPTGGTNASAISSYSIAGNGTLTAVSTSVPTLGAATCWHVVTPDGKFVYTSNAGSATISGFSIAANGALTPIAGTLVGTNPAGSTNLDLAVSADGKFLYSLDSGSGEVSIFSIDQDGTLTTLGDATGVPAGAGVNGIATF